MIMLATLAAVDWRKELRDYLMAQARLTMLTSSRIYAAPWLPTNYKPSDGAALLYTSRGGGEDYSSGTLRVSVQFRAFGLTQNDAIAVDKALWTVLNDKPKAGTCMKMARLEVPGQILLDPDTEWIFSLIYYQIYFTNYSLA